MGGRSDQVRSRVRGQGWLNPYEVRVVAWGQGRRLDASAPPLRAEVSDGYGDQDFQASGVIFPTEGCWEITGQVGAARLTFVNVVIRV